MSLSQDQLDIFKRLEEDYISNETARFQKQTPCIDETEKFTFVKDRMRIYGGLFDGGNLSMMNSGDGELLSQMSELYSSTNHDDCRLSTVIMNEKKLFNILDERAQLRLKMDFIDEVLKNKTKTEALLGIKTYSGERDFISGMEQLKAIYENQHKNLKDIFLEETTKDKKMESFPSEFTAHAPFYPGGLKTFLKEDNQAEASFRKGTEEKEDPTVKKHLAYCDKLFKDNFGAIKETWEGFDDFYDRIKINDKPLSQLADEFSKGFSDEERESWMKQKLASSIVRGRDKITCMGALVKKDASHIESPESPTTSSYAYSWLKQGYDFIVTKINELRGISAKAPEKDDYVKSLTVSDLFGESGKSPKTAPTKTKEDPEPVKSKGGLNI